MARSYSVSEVDIAVKTLLAFKEGVYIPDAAMEDIAVKLATAAISAALSIVATGLGEIISEHERANAKDN